MTWIGWTVGMSGPTVKAAKDILRRKYASYAGALDDSEYFGPDLQAVLVEYQTRRNAEGASLRTDGVLDYATQDSLGMIAHNKPIMFTVEGHQSNMWSGPVADTAATLEAEGVLHHQPVGYDCGALPFDNQSGIDELARLVGATVMDNGVPFPAGTPFAIGGFSQGGIVISYFYFDYLAPGKPLDWRLPDLRGVLAYGNPCRQTGSVADWARPWISKTGTHGLDPYRRFGLPGYPVKPDNWVDVYREGDIFAENGDDQASAIKAAVYQAVMSDWTSTPYSIAANIAWLFEQPIIEIMGIVQAIVSGIGFLADNPNPHYSDFSLDGGIAWMRSLLTA